MDLFEGIIEADSDDQFVLISYHGKKLRFPRSVDATSNPRSGGLTFYDGESYEFVTDGKRFVTVEQDSTGTAFIVAFDLDDRSVAGKSITHVSSRHYVDADLAGAIITVLFPQAPEPVVEKKPVLPINGEEDAYLNLLRHVLVNGERRYDRTGVGTLSVFAPDKLRFSLRDGRFPLLTTKKLHTRSIFEELFWFLRAETNNNSLREKKVTIWDEWAKEDGDLGPVYGFQWRRWPKLEKLQNLPGNDAYISRTYVDQIEELVHSLKTNPHGRRHLVAAWNPGMIHEMALPPCHILSQFYVDNDDGLHCQMYQRSADLFLGVPFNIASYALLTHLIAKKTGLNAASLTMSFGDAHIYTNHFDQVRLQTSRDAKDFPRITIRGNQDTLSLEHLTLEDVTVEGYTPHPTISAPVAK